ncbi:sterol desaturase family protein [Brevundimonas sp.]|uniref:sterol desaturase family protein n=1 Tax=Brevundimonas sp. TaxID=1871086 RepID=UPI002D453E0A|nr:sterol desaturase family protein [Brevundimonas sp.]HYC98063.1 sterol desaturase family protein [Brevundimonas sp.]
MSGLLSLRPSHLLADPAGSAMVMVDSLARNVTAEAWFYGQFLAAVVFGVAIDLIRRRDLPSRYGSKGVRVDAVYGLLEFLHVIQFAVILPVGLLVARGLQTWAPWLEVRALADLPVWVQLLILFVVTDFCVYWWHRLQHESRIVWQFHKTHHSQVHLNVLTTFRATVIDRVVALVVLAVPAAMMKVDAALPVAIAALLQFHQLIIHSDSGWSFGPLDKLFVSPSFHEVHHSSLEPHLDRNYGGVLSVWDHLFGTWAPRGDQELVYGLVAERLPEAWFRQQLVPVIGLWRLFRERTAPSAKVEPAA